MDTSAKPDSAALIAELNDLLQLDRDAVQAYTLAEKGLKSEEYKASIRRFKADHERHIQELERLISARGATPASLPHLSSSPFKLAAQGLGDLGSDTSVLLAFKSNERLSRDKYQRAANQSYPLDVQAVLEAGAEDESAHYEWVQGTLEQLGAGESTTVGKAEKAFETGHARLADVMESGEKRAMAAVSTLREKASGVLGGASEKLSGVSDQLGNGGLRNVWIALGVGLVASQIVGRSSSRKSASRAPKSRLASSPTQSRRPAYGGMDGDVAASRDVGLPAL